MCTCDIDQKVVEILRRKQLVKLTRLKQYMVCLSTYAIFAYSIHVWSLLSHLTVHVIIIDRVKKHALFNLCTTI